MDLPDYRPPAGENDSGSDHDQSDGEGQQQQLGAAAAEAKAAKRRRKRGPKLSAMEFEAKRQMAQQVAECSAEEQADWCAALFRGRGAGTCICIQCCLLTGLLTLRVARGLAAALPPSQALSLLFPAL